MPRLLLPPLALVVTMFLPAAPAFAHAVAPRVASTLQAPAGEDEKSDKDQAPAKNAGSIDGQVAAVDYGAGRISVKSANARYDVIVLPSTSIQGKNNTFHTIADIHKGAHVQVIMSQKAGTLTAQIIRLL